MSALISTKQEFTSPPQDSEHLEELAILANPAGSSATAINKPSHHE
jgi:hypothetical protein